MKNTKVILASFVLGIFILVLMVVVKSDGTAVSDNTLGFIKLQEALVKHPDAKASFDALQKFKEEREKDLQSKIKNKNLSDKEKEQINTLAQKYDQEIQQKDNQLTKVLFDDIEAAIKEIAKEKNLSVVLDSQAVLYGGVDITQDVIDKLKSGFKVNKAKSTKAKKSNKKNK